MSNMSEETARYIALISAAAKSIFAFALYSFIFIGMRMPYMSVEGNRVPADIIIALYIFLCIGALIIWGAFNKIAFYILTAIETLVLFLIFTSWPLSIIFFAPEIFYYIMRIRALCKPKE